LSYIIKPVILIRLLLKCPASHDISPEPTNLIMISHAPHEIPPTTHEPSNAIQIHFIAF